MDISRTHVEMLPNGFTNLQEAVLAGCPVEDIDDVLCFPELRSLNVSHSLVKSGPQKSNLIGLNVSWTAISSLDWIEGSPHLEELILAATNINNIQQLAQCRSLRYVDVRLIPTQDISFLGTLPSLQSCDISKYQLASLPKNMRKGVFVDRPDVYSAPRNLG